MGHDFLAIYPAKAMEYGLAIGYLLLFIPFWRFVQGGKPAAEKEYDEWDEEVQAPAPKAVGGAGGQQGGG